MKLEFIDKDHFVLYLMKFIIKDINFSVKTEIEKYFQKLFKRLKDYYNIDIEGYYNIKLYIDKYYGVVLDIQKEDVDYYHYFDNSVDMRITTIENDFMYEIKDTSVLKSLINKISLFQNQNKIYIKLNDNITEKDIMTLLEYAKPIYKEENKNYKSLYMDKII